MQAFESVQRSVVELCQLKASVARFLMVIACAETRAGSISSNVRTYIAANLLGALVRQPVS